MKKITVASMAALMAITAALPIATTSAEARNRGRNIAIGAGILLGAAALAASSNRAYANDYRPRGRSGFWSTCRKWLRQCNNGNDWSCEKYETRGCTE